MEFLAPYPRLILIIVSLLMVESWGIRVMPGGRPTKYDPKYCDEIIEFFDIEPYKEVPKTITSAKGSVIEDISLVPERLPTFERFAHKIGVHVDTMIEWCSKYEEFSEAYSRAKQLQKDFLIANGLSGLFNAAFTKFVAINITDMRDKTETDITSKGESISQPNAEVAEQFSKFLKEKK